ncbi:hypothetical protein ETAE_3101 [Edwardsiella piscicida]|uniref:Uncharacterized protein n=1 Tax=Edwardsiella piscicida TaxID=1263550 RepID=A0AAU8P8J1_EDWPI|nr:hypothetical protein ETAE_3101 [Edwardsiella tarda EIB202]
MYARVGPQMRDTDANPTAAAIITDSTINHLPTLGAIYARTPAIVMQDRTAP